MNRTIPTSTRAAFLLAALAAGGGVASIAGAAPQQAPEQGFAWKDGVEVYEKVCALCHGTKLLGRGLDPLHIRYTVRHGSRAMPAFRASEIDDQILERLAEYVSKTAADK